MSARRLLLLLLILSGLAEAASAAREIGPNRWTDVPRIVAFGDVHGAYDELVITLKAADVVDDQLDWTAGDTHLVSLGDLLDRGPRSRLVMELLMRLQTQAPAAGGRVHLVVGNHELMNLTGDLRYVSAEEFAAFANEETPAMRDAAFADYLAGDQSEAGDAAVEDARRQFDERFPPGYFAQRRAFSPHGRYGSWLLRQPLMVILNGTVFVHGGLPPVTAELSLQDMNTGFDADVAEILQLGATLVQAGWLDADVDLLLQDTRVAEHLNDSSGSADPAQVAAGKRFVSLVRGDLFGNLSPNWYRGTARCHRTLEQPVLMAALQNLDAQRVVVGHTPTSNRRVQQRLSGHALLADTGMLRSYYGGQPAPLVLTGSALEILYPLHDTIASTPDYIHPLQVQGMPPDTLEELLANAPISAVEEPATKDGTAEVALTVDDKTLNVSFEPGSRQANKHKVAAYRLSRLLELNLVPVTVAREVAGRSGVLLALPAEQISEAERAASQMGRPNWCAVGNDYELMYAFDALIGNDQRTTETMIYDRQSWQLYLTGHAGSFGTGSGVPRYLASIEKILPGSLPADLKSLTEEQLQETLGDELSRRQVRALLKRRDRMLETWTERDSK